MSLRDLILKKKYNDKRVEPKITYTKGIMVDVEHIGDPSVEGRPGFVWVKEFGNDDAYFQCFNPNTKIMNNLPVLIAHDITKPLRRLIVGVDWDSIPLYTSYAGQAYGIPTHHTSHEWQIMHPGEDALNVYPRAFIPLKTFPGNIGISISVQMARYMRNAETILFGGEFNLDISEYLPTVAGHYIALLVYLDVNTNSIKFLAGPDGTDIIPDLPDIPSGCIPSAFVRLTQGLAYISEAEIMDDARPFFKIDGAFDERYAPAILEAEIDMQLSRHVVEGV